MLRMLSRSRESRVLLVNATAATLRAAASSAAITALPQPSRGSARSAARPRCVSGGSSAAPFAFAAALGIRRPWASRAPWRAEARSRGSRHRAAAVCRSAGTPGQSGSSSFSLTLLGLGSHPLGAQAPVCYSWEPHLSSIAARDSPPRGWGRPFAGRPASSRRIR